MITIAEYVKKNPCWIDGSPTTYKKVRTAITKNKLKANQVKRVWYVEDRLPDVEIIKEVKAKPAKKKKPATVEDEDNNFDDDLIDLKDEHTRIKIEKDKQALYEQRLLLAEKVKDVFVEEFYLPRIAGLTEIVRKFGSKNPKLLEAWNKEIKNGATRNLKKLQEALQELTMK